VAHLLLLRGLLKWWSNLGRNFKLEKLQRGETITTSEKGNSMVPLIKSGQEHILEPATWETVEVGDIAYCKVKGNWYTHIVTAKNDNRGCQISNNSGYVNGWTKAVYGVVTEVIGGNYKRKKKKEMNEFIDEYEFTHFLYENYDEATAEEVDKAFGDSFGSCAMNTFYKIDEPQDEFDECMNAFIDKKGTNGKVQLIFTN
jgi:hypothetical protein